MVFQTNNELTEENFMLLNFETRKEFDFFFNKFNFSKFIMS